MSLRRQNLSPTANLLRNSRLFSLPKPLPKPLVAEPFGSGSLKASDTATLPYPTHQAVVTTPASRARGDWGFKRPLPARSRFLQTSDPVVRVSQWDTIEHVTDYDSAADHVRTREKFEELNTPILKGMAAFAETGLGQRGKSAFEPDADVTTYDVDAGLDGDGLYFKALQQYVGTQRPTEAESQQYEPPSISEQARSRENKRWKHDGPWLPGMSAGDFVFYLTKQLSRRKAEFNQYMVAHVKARIYASRRKASLEKETVPLDPAEADAFRVEQEQRWAAISEGDIAAGIRRLRAECAANPLDSTLVKNLIIPFLRLPPIKLQSSKYDQGDPREITHKRFSDETTPSTTHPSAGLGYLRTKSYLTSHPILGPQTLPSPITARVIQPKKTGQGTIASARLGVAGFIANDEMKESRNQFNNRDRLITMDIDTPGGAKVNVQAEFAAVAPDGKVHIKTVRSVGPELAVSRGQLDDRPPQRDNVEDKPMSHLNLGKSGVPELDSLSAQAKEQKERIDEQRMTKFKDIMGQMGHSTKS